jgi:hypothetical protein
MDVKIGLRPKRRTQVETENRKLWTYYHKQTVRIHTGSGPKQLFPNLMYLPPIPLGDMAWNWVPP